MSSRSADYRRLFKRVRTIINGCDPMGLIAAGCPADEYDQEVSLVLIAMKDAISQADLRARIKGVFAERFSPTDVAWHFKWGELARELWAIRETEGSDGGP